MAGTFTVHLLAVKNLYISKEFAPRIATLRPGGTCRGQNDRSVARPGEYCLEWAFCLWNLSKKA